MNKIFRHGSQKGEKSESENGDYVYINGIICALHVMLHTENG